eukprot:SAG31_NODE_9709_length_1239_cov_0.933333_3_plen_149_part_01
MVQRYAAQVLFNLAGSTAMFFMCLTQQATLWEGVGLFVAYVIYVLCVTLGHRVPPLLKADREKWYAAKSKDNTVSTAVEKLLADGAHADDNQIERSHRGSVNSPAIATADRNDLSRLRMGSATKSDLIAHGYAVRVTPAAGRRPCARA